MSTSETVIFDLEDAITVLSAALREARRLDATTVPTTDEKGIKRGDPATAAALRDIQRLAEMCTHASVEVSRAYWSSRGYTDPLTRED